MVRIHFRCLKQNILISQSVDGFCVVVNAVYHDEDLAAQAPMKPITRPTLRSMLAEQMMHISIPHARMMM